MKTSTVEKLSELIDKPILYYPFRGRKIALRVLLDDQVPVERHRLSSDDVQTLSEAIGDAPDILKLEAVLRKHCGVTSEPEIHSNKGLQTDQNLRGHFQSEDTDGHGEPSLPR